MLRSMLFIPGNSPGMLLKSDCLGAHAVIFDLEDSVAPSEKDAARQLVYCFLREIPLQHVRVLIRINGLSTPFGAEDIQLLAPVITAGIVLPKVESAEDIGALEAAVCAVRGHTEGLEIYPQLETARGIENAYEVATASSKVAALLLGGEDLTVDIGCRRTTGGEEISYARARLLNAAVAAGIGAYDTPYTDTENPEGLTEDVLKVHRLGFSGKMAIHPSQVDIINEGFAPSNAEISHAQEIVDVYEQAQEKGIGSVALHGKMIDVPVYERAKKLLAEVNL